MTDSSCPAAALSEPTASASDSRVWDVPEITVRLQPEETDIVLPRHKVKNVQQLLKVLGIRPNTAIVARGDRLLTPDQATVPGDRLLVRKVTSSG